MERINSETTICGYPLYDLLAFAQICRRENIQEDELKDFVNNCSKAYEIIKRETQQAMFDCIKSQLKNYESTA